MQEIKIANYTLLITLLLMMTTFYASVQSLSYATEYGKYPSLISGYSY